MSAILMLALVACGQPQAKRKSQLNDAQVRELRNEGFTENCIELMRRGGPDAIPDNAECFKTTPRQRWRGLFRDEFEAPTFCPYPARECPEGLSRKFWLTLKARPPWLRRAIPGGLYSVDFIGRHTVGAGAVDAFGFEHEMIVDRLLSIEQLEAPPKE